MTVRARRTVMAAMAVLLAGCSATPANQTPTEPSPTGDAGATSGTAPGPEASPIASLGSFPEFPEAPLPEQVAGSLQAALDGAIEDGTTSGVTAAVIVAGSGSWSGASGTAISGEPLTSESRLLTGSVAKTVIAAEVLRLVDEGALALLDPITDHLPPRAVAAFDANGATVRDVLGMRSGIPDPPYYTDLVDSGLGPVELLEETVGPRFPAGSEIRYANINYLLLGMAVEHVTARRLWNGLRSGVLERPSLDGLGYRVKDALAADGWGVESDAASLARWGYELYGGFVVSDASLGEMTDFGDGWYGLGTIDFASSPVPGGYDSLAIGHGGAEPPGAAALVAFPEIGVVIAAQTPNGDLEEVHAIVRALREAAAA